MPKPKTRLQRRLRDAQRLSTEATQARQVVVKSVARDIYSMTDGLNMKEKYGAVGREMATMKNLYPWLTKGMVKYQISLLKKKEVTLVVAHDFDVSELGIGIPKIGGRPIGTSKVAKEADSACDA